MTHFDHDLAAGLRAGMRRLASGVSVVSLRDVAGVRQAMTVTSVTSVSDHPPSLLLCVNRQANALPALLEKLPFCVNVLHREQEEISVRCASLGSGDTRFALGDWRDHPQHNLPYLADAEVNFFCDTDAVFEYGTHYIIVGKLSSVWTSDTKLEPLVYANGHYHHLA